MAKMANHADLIDEFFFPTQGRSSMDMQFWHQKRSSLQKSLRSLRHGFFRLIFLASLIHRML